MRILLVEDNPLTAKGLKYLLEKEQYTVIEVPDLSIARAELAEHNFDLALLDVSHCQTEKVSLWRTKSKLKILVYQSSF